jgi:predicted aconitase with swiveling domain
MSQRVFRVPQAFGPVVVAPVLVNPRPFSARYDLDRVSGLISRTDHPLRGQPVAGRILLSPLVQGGVAAALALLTMANSGVGFAALVFGELNPVMVQGAVTAGVPIGAGIDPRAFDELVTGTLVRFDPGRGTLSVVDEPAPERVSG